MKKFKPIKVEDKEMIRDIDELRQKKNGFYLMLLDLAKARNQIEKELRNWFKVAFEKYDIPDEYRNKVTYFHNTQEIKMLDKKGEER